MVRTRLRQIEQFRSSETYDDYLNQSDSTGASTEGQPGYDKFRTFGKR